MKLQLNNSGAWKQVMDFDGHDCARVMVMVSRLAAVGEAIGSDTKWRLLDDRDRVTDYYDRRRGGWYVPARWGTQ